MDLGNYVTVEERQRAAFARWPELRLVEESTEVVEIGSDTFVSVTVAAWRTPDDPIPARATCWEPYPGRSPFTRGSEQANAATSAKGRLFGLMLADFGAASADEVRNRQADNVESKGRVVRPGGGAVPHRADSPSDRGRPVVMDEPPRPARTYVEPDPAGPIPRRSGADPATDAQLRKLRAMMRGNGVDGWSPPDGFSKADASALIDELTAELAGKGDQ